MDRNYFEGLQEQFSDLACQGLRDAIEKALGMLRHDIDDPQLTREDSHADAFMLRANQLGLALFKCGAFAVAERLYRDMAKLTKSYRTETGAWRHAGAMNANMAAACAAQGNIDEAVVQLFRAAEDDVPTYPIDQPDESFAITDLLEQYFCAPVRKDALQVVQTIDRAISMPDLHSLGADLGHREYAFLAYVRLAVLHARANDDFRNIFSQLQIFSALRSLSCLLEVHLKTLAGLPNKTLYPAAKALFDHNTWWGEWDRKRKDVGATKNSTTPVDDRLRSAIALTPTDEDSRFWKSLLVACIARPYTVHQMETECALVQEYPYEALGHILHVMVAAPDHM